MFISVCVVYFIFYMNHLLVRFIHMHCALPLENGRNRVFNGNVDVKSPNRLAIEI